MKLTTQEQRERLTKELSQLKRRRERRYRDDGKDACRQAAIEAELRRLEFVDLVGKPGAVTLRLRPEDSCLTELRGTVVELGDTYALVAFGTWGVNLSGLVPSDKPQDDGLNQGDGTP